MLHVHDANSRKKHRLMDSLLSYENNVQCIVIMFYLSTEVCFLLSYMYNAFLVFLSQENRRTLSLISKVCVCVCPSLCVCVHVCECGVVYVDSPVCATSARPYFHPVCWNGLIVATGLSLYNVG